VEVENLRRFGEFESAVCKRYGLSGEIKKAFPEGRLF
jgi:hypothetical protein